MDETHPPVLQRVADPPACALPLPQQLLPDAGAAIAPLQLCVAARVPLVAMQGQLQQCLQQQQQQQQQQPPHYPVASSSLFALKAILLR
jgi:hypothetical protein